MSAIRVSSAVMLTPLILTTQESALSHLQALLTALLSSSLELAPHQAEPGAWTVCEQAANEENVVQAVLVLYR